VAADASSLEQELAFAINWARTRNMIQPGQHIVLLRGEMPGQAKTRGVLVRKVS
jgi:hypothetical protein